ncbi:MAG: hypothetical protein J6Y37_06730 [Paludibacteraceae bacterium]|nr:hypothetical protein [Paludibacteraceae bacterium]
MSRIKVNDRVLVKESGEIGTVVTKETIRLEGNRVKVEYIVKFGDGFENYRAFGRKELSVVKGTGSPSQRSSVKEYTYESILEDGRIICIVGLVGIAKYKALDIGDNGIVPLTVKRKTLNVGYAICHPGDRYEYSLGLNIARRRAKERPLAKLESAFGGEFDESFVGTILAHKAEFIADNIERFIGDDE